MIYPSELLDSVGFWSNSTIKFPINNAIAPTGNQKVMLPSSPKNRDADIAHTGSNAYNIAALTGDTCFWKIYTYRLHATCPASVP